MGLFRRDKTEERLESLDSYVSEWTEAPDAVSQTDDGPTAREQLAAKLDLLVDKSMAGSIKAQLRKADLKLTVSEYMLAHAAASGLLGLVGFVLQGSAFGAGVGAIAGFFVPRMYVGMRQSSRLEAFQNQLPDILNLWVNSLRAGFSVPQAMEAVAREAPAPACDEFRRVVSEIQIGIPMEVALNNMLSRIESEDLDLVFTAVNIQREVGGNLAEILETITHTIRERIRIKGEIQTLTASGRATGTLISGLPIGLGCLLYWMNPDYMGQLFFGPPVGAFIPATPIPCGWPIVGVGLIMIGMGIAVIGRIIDIEV